MRATFIYTLIVMALVGCGSKTDTDKGSPQPGGGEHKGKGDFATPAAAVETFIAAATARDTELLSQCIAVNSTPEFAKLRNKTASQKDLDGLTKLMQGGTITGVKADDQKGTAVVSVKLKSRNERIKMTKTAEGWKVVDF